jgi:hypothetical protein
MISGGAIKVKNPKDIAKTAFRIDYVILQKRKIKKTRMKKQLLTDMELLQKLLAV